MFDQLTNRLDNVFKSITGRGLITEVDVDKALREIRIALLEADVALPVIKRLVKIVKEKAVGENVLKSISPGQQVVKVVNDALIEVLGETEDLNLATQPPAVVMMVGLQGSGKTTTTGKLAKLLKGRGKKVLLASLDIYRPAAQEQLQTLATRADVGSLDIIANQKPVEITKRALDEARKGGYDVLFLDTAGRLEIDDALMDELIAVKNLANPVETMLVADSLTGQVAVQVAQTFNQKVGVSAITLTRIDGDGRGGAALSMREVTGKPIKYLATGEGLNEIQSFSADRIANRILGMGDVVSLVEKVQESTSEEDMMGMMERMFSGEFDLMDMRKQLSMVKKMGSMKGIMGLMPGMRKLKKQFEQSNVDDSVIIHQIAVIDSMTAQERKNPSILNARRRQRIAKGAGVEVSMVNKVVKSHQQMGKMMKKMGGPAGMMNMLQNMNGPFGK